MQPGHIAMSALGGAFGGAVAVVIMRGVFPANHLLYLDYLLLLGAASVAFDAFDARNSTDAKLASAARTVGNAVGIAYVTGGTRVTRSLGLI